jgi:hypothetical protein
MAGSSDLLALPEERLVQEGRDFAGELLQERIAIGSCAFPNRRGVRLSSPDSRDRSEPEPSDVMDEKPARRANGHASPATHASRGSQSTTLLAVTEPWDVLKLVERVERLERDTRVRVLLAQYSVATSRHVLHRAGGVVNGVFGAMPASSLSDRSRSEQ